MYSNVLLIFSQKTRSESISKRKKNHNIIVYKTKKKTLQYYKWPLNRYTHNYENNSINEKNVHLNDSALYCINKQYLFSYTYSEQKSYERQNFI